MNVNIEDVRRTIASTFEIPVERVRDDSSTETIEQWDSVGHIDLVMALELRFGLRFTVEEITRLRSFGSICQVLGGKDSREKTA